MVRSNDGEVEGTERCCREFENGNSFAQVWRVQGERERLLARIVDCHRGLSSWAVCDERYGFAIRAIRRSLTTAPPGFSTVTANNFGDETGSFASTGTRVGVPGSTLKTPPSTG